MPTDEDLLKQIVTLLSGGGTITITGSATAAKQDTGNTSVASIDTKLTSQATAAKQDTLATAVAATNTKLDTAHTDLAAGNVSTASIDAKISAAAVPSDAMDNATTMGALRARLQAFNGTTWDRLRSAVTTVSATLTGFANTLPWGLFHAAPVTRTEGQGGPFETDAKGNLRTSEQAPPAYENVADASVQCHEKPATSAAFNAIPYDIITIANAGVVKAAPGNLYRLYITNDDAAANVYALVNKATTPVNGDTAVMFLYVPTKTTMVLEWKFGKRFSAGIGWAQVTAIAATITLGTAHSLADGECS
jgi:hypothetical protein